MLTIERDTMRYRIISRENDNANDFVNLTIAGFRHPDDAIKVCGVLPIPCYVVDTLTNRTLADNRG